VIIVPDVPAPGNACQEVDGSTSIGHMAHGFQAPAPEWTSQQTSPGRVFGAPGLALAGEAGSCARWLAPRVASKPDPEPRSAATLESTSVGGMYQCPG
jgi:hypothetical protein